METWNDILGGWLQQIGISAGATGWCVKIIWFVAIWLITWIFTIVFRRLIIPALQKVTSRTKVKWDDHLFSDGVLRNTTRFIPPLIWLALLPVALEDMPQLLSILSKAIQIYLIIVGLMLASAFFDVLYNISNMNENLRNRPLKGIYQMLNILTICVGIILIISIIINKDATVILAGLGAAATVLMLIFKDSILGLVSGVQLSANDMLRPGDWITMDKYGADGFVTEVSLTTVKVQNFDKTITTIPPYALVSDSFQNWRGMWEYGGRRIKRALYIDASTIRFCTVEELQRFREQELILGECADDKVSNLTILENYILRYLAAHPDINEDMLTIVRTLQPVAEGVPLELYCFTRTTDWVKYESIQDDIIGHVISAMPQFALRVYQRPSADDVSRIVAK